MGLELPGGVEGALRAAKQQQEMQQQLQAILNAALQGPHTIEQINVNAAKLVHNGSDFVLLVGTVPGKRFDIVLGPAAIAQIVREATAEDEAATAAAKSQEDGSA